VHRRLIAFVIGVAAIEALFFSTLAPLLPSFEDDLDLSKAEVGLLVAMYAIGWGIAVVPVAVLASRVGVKRFAVVGLTSLCVSSVGFGIVNSYALLLAMRCVQGIAAALCFSAALAWLIDVTPSDRRSGTISIYGSAAAAGTLAGPLVGGAAVLIGRDVAFSVVAGLTLAFAFVGLRFPGPPVAPRQPFVLLRDAHRSRAVLGYQWLVTLPGLLLGTVFALAPLQLDRAGWSSTAIAGTFLTAAAAGAVTRVFVGRWADANGLARAVRLIVLAGVPFTLAVPWLDSAWLIAPCVVCAITSYGLLWGPTMALVSHAYEEHGVSQVVAFALMGLTSGIGLFVGSGAGGALADAAGDATVYVLLAAIGLATAAATGGPLLRRLRSSARAERASLRTR
jgi:MFS transporter, DHA1 family, solute carrier family 18 (vesicular amine transporter), member 1/2